MKVAFVDVGFFEMEEKRGSVQTYQMAFGAFVGVREIVVELIVSLV